MKWCKHEPQRIVVEVHFGESWELLDQGGDVIDYGVDRAERLRLVVMCSRCHLGYTCTEAGLGRLPARFRGVGKRALKGWREALARPAIVVSLRAAAKRRS